MNWMEPVTASYVFFSNKGGSYVCKLQFLFVPTSLNLASKRLPPPLWAEHLDVRET